MRNLSQLSPDTKLALSVSYETMRRPKSARL